MDSDHRPTGEYAAAFADATHLATAGLRTTTSNDGAIRARPAVSDCWISI